MWPTDNCELRDNNYYQCCILFMHTGQLSGDVRLIDTSGLTGGRGVGRLEVYYSGQWGTVCQDGFGPAGALVACRQLGFLGYVVYGIIRK